MHWMTSAAMVSDRQASLRADAEGLRAGRIARRRRARANRSAEQAPVAPAALAPGTRRNGHAPQALAPTTTC